MSPDIHPRYRGIAKKDTKSLYLTINDEDLVRAIDRLAFDHGKTEIWEQESCEKRFRLRESIMGHWFRGKGVAERYGKISDHGLLDAIDGMKFENGDTEI